MPELSPDGTLPRRINDPLDVGSAHDGNDVRLNLRMEDGSTEWFDIHHANVPRFVAGVLFAAGVARRERPSLSPSGNPIPQKNELIQPSGMSLLEAPEGLVLQVAISPEVNLDFHLPREAAEHIYELLGKLLSVAPTGKSSSH